MDSIFFHSPEFWWQSTPEERPQKVDKLMEERRRDGFGFWDWINFDTFYGTLSLRALELVAMGYGDLEEEVIFKASVLAEEGNRLKAKALEADRENDTATLQLLWKEENDYIKSFILDFIPSLPFKEDYTLEPLDRQGFVNPGDMEYLGSFLSRVLADGLARFLSDGTGHPGDLEEEQWNTILKAGEKALRALPEISEEDRKALGVICDYYHNLWD